MFGTGMANFSSKAIMSQMRPSIGDNTASQTTAKCDKDEIFQIKEIIREKALRTLRDEVPHSLAVYMENIEWEDNPIHIRASLIV